LSKILLSVLIRKSFVYSNLSIMTYLYSIYIAFIEFTFNVYYISFFVLYRNIWDKL